MCCISMSRMGGTCLSSCRSTSPALSPHTLTNLLEDNEGVELLALEAPMAEVDEMERQDVIMQMLRTFKCACMSLHKLSFISYSHDVPVASFVRHSNRRVANGSSHRILSPCAANATTSSACMWF